LRVLSFVCLVLVCAGLSRGQDFIFSNYNYADYFINPALPSLIEEDIRFTGKFRGQWESFASGFKTVAAQMDVSPLNKDTRFCGKRLVISPQIMQDVAGSLRMSTTVVNLNLSYSQFLDRNYKIQLLAGMQSGYTFRSIDLSRARVGSEFFNSGETVDVSDPNVLNRSNYINLATGIGMAFYPRRDVNFSVGMAGYNLIGQNISFIKDGLAKEYRRINTYLNGNYQLNDANSVNAYIITQFQGPYKSYLIGGTWGHHFGKQQFGEWVNQVFIGGGLRWQDAVVTTFGYGNERFNLSLNYDINISPLIRASRSVGAFEVSMSFNTDIFKSNQKCPRVIPCSKFR
jgi:type IX secretion system PorP/SprF family membrane protein